MVNFNQAKFLISVAKPEQLPQDQGVEVAFAGRSNAGKSSVINLLTHQKNLARTSKTPGRTQLINFFQLGEEFKYLVDLPGYGYAKVSAAKSKLWAYLIDHYLTARQNLQGIVLVMDIRHPLRDFDQQMLEWSRLSQMPIHLLLNKADKLKYGGQKQALLKVQQFIADNNFASVQLFSALKRTGVDDLINKLEQWYQTQTP